MHRKSRQLKSYFSAATVTIAAGLWLAATNINAATDESEAEGRFLEEVVVTATRRSESVQDVPLAITVVDQESLERATVLDITGIERVAPSFSINSTDTATGGTTVRIRGVGTTGNNIGLESSVGVFIDGIYVARAGSAISDGLDVKQVEVLRGPQGTLFGRNTSAGALVINTNKPNLQEFEGFANVSAGDYDFLNTQLVMNIPVIEDEFAIRLAGAYRERDGIIDGQGGYEGNTLDRLTFRGQALWDLGNQGELRLIAGYSEGDDECCLAVWLQDSPFIEQFSAPFSALAPTAGAPNTGPDTLDDYRANNDNFSNPFEGWGYSLEYNVSTSFGELTYLGAYSEREGDSCRGDYTENDIYAVGDCPRSRALGLGVDLGSLNGTTIDSSSHEVRLQGKAFDDRVDWLVGLYYSKEEIDQKYTLAFLSEMQSAVSIGAFGQPTFNELNFVSGGVDATGDYSAPNARQSGDSFSLFTHNIIELGDRLDLTVGLRYVEETKNASLSEQVAGQHNACEATFNSLAANIPIYAGAESRLQAAVATNCWIFTAPFFDTNDPNNFFQTFATNPTAQMQSLLNLIPQPYTDIEFSDDELVYTASLKYDLNDTTIVYGGFTHGFKSGGFNLDVSGASGGKDPRFDSEKIDAFELGIKADFWDNRIRTNIALFHSEMEDYQVLEFDGVRFVTFNVPKAESRGVELESLYQVTDYWGLNLAATYADAKYPDDCGTFNPTDPGFSANVVSLCGERLTNSPRWVVVAGSTYERPVFDDSMYFFARLSARYESDRRTSTQPTETPFTVGAATEADVRAAIAAAVPLPGDVQKEHTKIDLRIGLQTADQKYSIELWGTNITDERTKFTTFNIPFRGFSGSRARGMFVQEPSFFGLTARMNF